VAAILAATLLLAATATEAQTSNNEIDAAALRLSQAAIGHGTGDYEFTEAGGRTLRLADLRGRPVVLSLVFTQCYGVCSGFTLRLREAVRVARATLGPGRFTVLTVGFDTKHDTPELMRAYGRDRGVDDADWHFVSADAETVRRLTDDIGFTYRPSAAGFDHVAQVTLLDRAGVVAGQLYGQDFEPPALVEPLRELVLGRGLARASVSDLITRVRLYCSVYDPATGRYRFDFAMLASALPALLVLGIVALGLLAAGRRAR
jgi:protein SCO1/2